MGPFWWRGPPLREEDWMVLSTIHSAKGCEWDVVYVIHAADGNIPSDMATGDDDQIEEERRLFYVALTRARDFLERAVTAVRDPREQLRTGARLFGAFVGAGLALGCAPDLAATSSPCAADAAPPGTTLEVALQPQSPLDEAPPVAHFVVRARDSNGAPVAVDPARLALIEELRGENVEVALGLKGIRGREATREAAAALAAILVLRR